MRSVLIAITALFIGWNSRAIFTEPEDYRPVAVTVREGDTLEQIAYRLKEKYNDDRDWRYIVFQATVDNQIGEFIYPGQQIIFRVVRKK